jgi:hypothetical protein
METALLKENVGVIAVRKLRKEKLAMGIPFMINVKGLPDYHSYLEYPDGSISLVRLDSIKRDFFEVKKLSNIEKVNLLCENNLTD